VKWAHPVPKLGTILPRAASPVPASSLIASQHASPTPERQKSCNSRATSHREVAGASGGGIDCASGRARTRTHVDAWGGSGRTATTDGRHDEKSAGAKRTCARALLDTPRPCDMLARGKRTGIPITCRPRRTSTHSRRSGFDPTEPVATQEPMRWATERRHFKALLHEAHRRAVGTPHQLATSYTARPRRTWVACDLSPCFEVRGMRIAAHFRQAHDRQRPDASS